MTIWKYQLELTDVQTVEMPAGAQILCVQMQNTQACIWALIEPKNSPNKRHFEVFGTGYPIPEVKERKYIGTVQAGGCFVWHIFELTKL